jgi:hypothetical protein
MTEHEPPVGDTRDDDQLIAESVTAMDDVATLFNLLITTTEVVDTRKAITAELLRLKVDYAQTPGYAGAVVRRTLWLFSTYLAEAAPLEAVPAALSNLDFLILAYRSGRAQEPEATT